MIHGFLIPFYTYKMIFWTEIKFKLNIIMKHKSRKCDQICTTIFTILENDEVGRTYLLIYAKYHRGITQLLNYVHTYTCVYSYLHKQ